MVPPKAHCYAVFALVAPSLKTDRTTQEKPSLQLPRDNALSEEKELCRPKIYWKADY